MAQKKKQLVAEGKLDKHGRPNENTPKEYLRSLPDVSPAKVPTLPVIAPFVPPHLYYIPLAPTKHVSLSV